MESVTKVFALRLKKLREEKNLSLQSLGKELGISGVALGRYEREARVPTIETLILIADYFKVSADYLLGRAEK